MVLDSNIDFTLDVEEMNAQLEQESLMPAELVSSSYKVIPFTNDDGTTGNRDVWQLEWRRLDMDLGEMRYRSNHNLPNPNSERPVTNRRQMTYVKQVLSFDKLGLRGKNPAEFEGQRHWIKERVEGSGRYIKTWWESQAIYVEGQSYEEAKGGSPSGVAMNPPVEESNDNNGEDDASAYTLFVETVNGLAHRQAIAAVEAHDILKENVEIMNGVKSGAIFEQMIEQGFLKDEDGTYVQVGD